MQSRESLLPNARQKIKAMPLLIPLIARFTVSDELNNKYRNPGKQQDVDEAAFVKNKFQDEPDY